MRGALPVVLAALLALFLALPSFAAAPAGQSCECDEVLQRECTATRWEPVGPGWCQWSGRCGVLPTRWQEYKRTVTCTYRCWNGCKFTRQWTEYDVDAVGCCGSWFPPIPGSPEEPDAGGPRGCVKSAVLLAKRYLRATAPRTQTTRGISA